VLAERLWRAQRRRLPLPERLTALPSADGIAMLAADAPVGDYLRLSPFFETQDGPELLRADHHGDAPEHARRGPTTRFRGLARTIHPAQRLHPAHRAASAAAGGGAAGHVAADPRRLLEAHGLSTDLRFARDDDLDSFRHTAVAVLDDPGRGMAVNYLRGALGQEGRGHTSPLAAYHPESDRFLILDVSRYRYPPVWVRARGLFAAMNTEAGRNSRGYVVAAR
jgi:hypothetical protein